MTNINPQDFAQATNKAVAEHKATPLTMRPAADIHENKDGAVIYIDLPGVSKDALSIDVDKNVLTIRGNINLHTPDDLNSQYMDVHSGVFERRFTLGEQLDSENIEAKLEQGELYLFIPRSDEHKPRKIDVKVA
ncbi:MAG: HSP20 family molecular chaperone IbpA [uncultured Thiotrichaceae bacterium]|uniref:HSP20 family molecular chaperone IbpA n=1 Tax=uncultured Thiotrichaceae bacterium TaxID=298394 RepID=A0A6S6SSP6_9GAMM|nr:MAG: HSP20 family molecular chaperone IbpA [uncultured Thiotrichaceae bacterium]